MAIGKLESSLLEATDFFDRVVSRREKLIKDSRDVIALSSRSIISIHSSHYAEAKKLQVEAKRRLAELRKIAGRDLVKYILTPEQEFVESSIMYSLVTRREIASLDQLGVLPSSYILGIVDAIGELKRNVYDLIRIGRVSVAEEMFSAMESLFALTAHFAVYDNIVPGLRRKLDVGRMLIEDVRAVITEETRRMEFMTSINKLAERLGVSRDLAQTPASAKIQHSVEKHRSANLDKENLASYEEKDDENDPL